MKSGPKTILGAERTRRQVRILFSCAGRRLELISAFIRAAGKLGLKIHVVTVDAEAQVAAACLADRSYVAPPISSKRYVPALAEIARREKIDLLIPLLDNELLKLARTRDDFAAQGTQVVLSSPQVVRWCRDKLAMYDFFQKHAIAMPETWTPEAFGKLKRYRYPYFLKPRGGSASQGNHILRNQADVEAYVPRVKDPIIQEFALGDEFTLDVYTGFDGLPRCVVPRQRLEIRGGEVTKASTVRHKGITEAGRRVAEVLAGCVGVITVQLFLASNGEIRVIEVNPRFGGGVPLAIHAGADFPRWLIMEWLGRKPRIRMDHYREGVTMLRYHESFFLEGGRQSRVKRAKR